MLRSASISENDTTENVNVNTFTTFEKLRYFQKLTAIKNSTNQKLLKEIEQAKNQNKKLKLVN